MLNTIIEGNTLDILKTMPDNSVDCVITSPPYWGLRKYGTDPQIFGGDPIILKMTKYQKAFHERNPNYHKDYAKLVYAQIKKAKEFENINPAKLTTQQKTILKRRQKYLENGKKQYAKNKEQKNEYSRAYYRKNREIILQKQKDKIKQINETNTF